MSKNKHTTTTAIVLSTVALVIIPWWIWRRSKQKNIQVLTKIPCQNCSCSPIKNLENNKSNNNSDEVLELQQDVEDIPPELERNNIDSYKDLDEGCGVVFQRIVPLTSIPEKNEKPNSIIPGSQLIYVKTFGCSHNSSDSEVMMGLLHQNGYQFTTNFEDSDVCLINSCTVKNPSQDAFMTMVNKAKEANKAVIVAGCVPQAERNLQALKGISAVGTSQISKIVEVVEETVKGNCIRFLSKCPLGTSLDMPKIRRNNFIEIIPISSGCLGSCTYCKTKHARGHLESYPIESILKRIQYAIDEGVQQIWFTSEDVGAYGLDKGTHIGELLMQCTELLEWIETTTGKRIMLRIGMTNPPYMAAHIDAVTQALKHRNVFKFIHIPVQSGSNSVLKDMIREYTVEDFSQLAETLILRVPNITIATDIICGFPQETDHDHLDTMNLIQKYEFPIVNISQFYARPGTPAAKMKRVPSKIIKKRSTDVANLFHSYKCTNFVLNSYQRVWFTDCEFQKEQTVGHTIHYIKVVVPIDVSLLGTSRWVKIVKVTKWHVEGFVQSNDISTDKDELYNNDINNNIDKLIECC